MAYVPAAPPVEYDASFLQYELQRIANAVNFQRAVGELLFDIDAVHAPQMIPLAPTKVIGWDIIGPDKLTSDGPILTSPRLSPDDDILILETGIYQIGFYVGFEHPPNETFLFEIYDNGVRTFIGGIVQASGGTTLSAISASAIKTISPDDVLDLRASCLSGTEIITMQAGGLFALKEMDKRTRVS